MATRTTMSLVVTAIVVPLMVGRGAIADEPRVSDEARVKAVRAVYEKLPPAILGVKEPIVVSQCAQQAVPVMFNVTFTDADGVNHYFAWWLDKGNFQNQEFDRIDWVRYTGVSSVEGKRVRLTVRGPEEDALFGLLLRWTAAKKAAPRLTPFEELMLKEMNGLLEKFDQRYAGEQPVPAK